MRLMLTVLLVACGVVDTAPPLAFQQDAQLPPYDVTRLVRGSEMTIVVLFGADCEPCRGEIGFYRELLKRPRVDGRRIALVVVSTDGVWPVQEVLSREMVKPHRLTSGPYPGRNIEGLQAPALLLLGPEGQRMGTFRGPLTGPDRAKVFGLVGS
jgi:hypothetical protein